MTFLREFFYETELIKQDTIFRKHSLKFIEKRKRNRACFLFVVLRFFNIEIKKQKLKE